MTATSSFSWSEIGQFMEELRGTARQLLAREGRAGSVTPTRLVLSALRRHKLHDQDWAAVRWEDREQFFRYSYQAMRRALVDYARSRRRRREIPAGNLATADLSPLMQTGVLRLHDLAQQCAEEFERAEEMDVLLQELDAAHPGMKLSLIVGHYAFGGLTQDEIAEIVGIDVRTVRRRLALAQSVLRQIWNHPALREGGPSHA